MENTTNGKLQEMIKYCKMYLANWKTFSGRSRRSEFWWPMLAIVIISTVLNIVTVILSFIPVVGTILGYVGMLFNLAIIVPTLAVGARRMHDIGRGFGWNFVPIYGFILALQDSEPGENRFGANPKENANA